MAYQIKKSDHISEELEFLGKNGEVELKITVDVNVDRIAGGYRKAEIELLTLQKKLSKGEQGEVLEQYGRAVINLFSLIFGEENTAKMIEYFDGKYSEMLMKTIPFINDVIKPAVNAAVSQYKQRAANNYNFSRRQRRKLGLK